MEKFAVDLDRVLDEFELNEDLAQEPADGKECGLINYEISASHHGSSSYVDVHSSQKTMRDDHFSGSDENSIDLSGADFAPTKSTTVAIVHKPKFQKNVSSQDLDWQILSSDEKKVPVSAMASVASKPHKLENGTSIVSGIKVLHCDETINKDYLLNFGRKWDLPTVNSPTAERKNSDDKSSTQPTSENFEPVASMVNEEIQDEGISMEESEFDTVIHNGNQHLLDFNEKIAPNGHLNSEETSDDTFVTPEQITVFTPSERPRIIFSEDVEVTDEELKDYLEKKDNVVSESVLAINHLQLDKDEFFTPMIEAPVCLMAEDVYPESGMNHEGATAILPRLLDLDNIEDAPKLNDRVCVQGDPDSGLLLAENSSKFVDGIISHNQEIICTKEKVYQQSKMANAEQRIDDRTDERSHSAAVSQEALEQCKVLARTEKVKERPKRVQKNKSVDEGKPHDELENENAVEIVQEINETVLSPPSFDDGYDAQIYESEQSIYDDIVPPGEYEELSNGQLRLQRPTSLHLPGKIQVTQPPNPVAQEALDDDENKPFATLMATAGSPDAGLGVSPGSYDETPSYPASPGSALIEEERQLGKVAPVWVPDAEAPNCMQCEAKFTVIKRRHHCRACGKVLCAQCCGLKAKLHYMENKEARVCQCCLEIMEKVLLSERASGGVATGSSGSLGSTDAWHPSQPSQICAPNPNNPSEYCSVIPPLQQCLANANAPPPTVMVPVGVLKRGGGSRPRGEPKQVMFSDGIRPGGDLTELDGPEPRLPFRRQGRLQKKVERPQGQLLATSNMYQPSPEQREYSLNDDLDMDSIMCLLKDETEEPLVFALIKNLKVLVNILDLNCCVHRTCWSFTTRGMAAVGQDEVVILIEFLPEEKTIPYDIFYHLIDIYDEAGKGITVSGMGHTVFTRSFLGSREHGGFLFVHPTFQCLQKIPLPPAPYLFGILLQKWEIPWAKVFPLRLLLRLGAEFRYYPAPIFGIRFRKPVFCEIGHTIVNLLADFRNYQYSLPCVPGLVIHMEDKQTYINFPRNRYDEVVKALNSSIDHVLSLAATFSTEADSHLVCVQNEDGNYQTQAINIKDKPRKVTGASFVVFNGALKSSSGLTAKSSIVEDGLMVQIPGDSMLALRQALRDMRDYDVPCGPIGTENPEEVVHMHWVDDDRNVNVGVTSPIDGMALDGISSIRIHCGTDYVGDGHLIRWTEVYLIRTDDTVGCRRSDPIDVSKVSDTLAQAGCVALAQHLSSLSAAGLTKIGLRVTLDSDNVGYEIGAGEHRLPAPYMNDLDSELVPAMHCAASPNQEGTVVLELIFHIIQQ